MTAQEYNERQQMLQRQREVELEAARRAKVGKLLLSVYGEKVPLLFLT